MKNDECGVRLIIPQPYSRRLYYSGMLSLLSVAVSLHLRMYEFTMLAAIVLLSSLNYWRYPIRGWRRNVDMVCVYGVCLYQVGVSFSLANPWCFLGYWLTLIIAGSSYGVARRYGRVLRNPDLASRWHMGIHLFGNVSNLILYYGLHLQRG